MFGDAIIKFTALIVLAAFLLLAVFYLTRSGDIAKAGQSAPDFALHDQNGVMHHLRDYAGKWLVLYFYPKDDTPGCTREACSFRDDLLQLQELGATVVGVSVDNAASHAEFARKYQLPFALLADTDGRMADSYGALTRLGPIRIAKRYTFLISPAGIIARTYLSVDTSRHSRQIIDDLRNLTMDQAS